MNADASIDVLDLLLVIGMWGTGIEGWHDVDGDGTLGIGEVLFILGVWGPLP